MQRVIVVAAICLLGSGAARAENICSPDVARQYAKAQGVKGQKLDYSLGGRCSASPSPSARSAMDAGYADGKREFCNPRRGTIDGKAEGSRRRWVDPEKRYGICDNVADMAAKYKDAFVAAGGGSAVGQEMPRPGLAHPVPRATDRGRWEAMAERRVEHTPWHPTVLRDGEDYYLAYELAVREPGQKSWFEGEVYKLSNGEWESLGGTQPGSCSSLVMHEGTLYMVFDGDTVRKWTGKKWKNVGAKAAPKCSWQDPAVLTFHDDEPYIIWQADLPRTRPIDARRYNGNKWVPYGDRLWEYAVAHNDLVFDSKGTAYTAFLDMGEKNKKINVRRYEKGKWKALPQPAVTGGGIWSDLPTAMHGDELYIAYVDTRRTDGTNTTDGMPVVITLDGDTWVPVGRPDFNGGADASFLKMGINDAGVIYVAFADRGPRRTELDVSVMRFVDGEWLRVGGKGFDRGTPWQVLFDASGNPIVVVVSRDKKTGTRSISLNRWVP